MTSHYNKDKDVESIGLFFGEPISKMNRDELLKFSAWAAKRIEGLEREVSKNPYRYSLDSLTPQ